MWHSDTQTFRQGTRRTRGHATHGVAETRTQTSERVLAGKKQLERPGRRWKATLLYEIGIAGANWLQLAYDPELLNKYDFLIWATASVV
jgi:hypothetical protein